MTGTEPHAWETGLMDTITYVGLDVHKATVCVALAESGRGGELRQLGVFQNRPEIVMKLAARLSTKNRTNRSLGDLAEPRMGSKPLRDWSFLTSDRRAVVNLPSIKRAGVQIMPGPGPKTLCQTVT